jgi:polar amino acid transport system substrate-binding protein
MARLSTTIALALAALGCGTSKDETSSTTASASDCTPGKLATHKKGELTVATDDPAYEPYFVDDKPENGKGFESAVAFAIGEQLGFKKAQVKWTTEPFNSSYAPGPKDFDFDVNEISITPAREKAVDFSAPYYTANQAIVAAKGTKAAEAKSLADLKEAKIGVQISTTSQEAVEEQIDPSSEIQVFNNSNDVITALKNGQVEAVAVDVPTALYVTAVQVPDATIVGQFPAPGGRRMGRAARQGLRADRLRLQRDRRTEELRRARKAQPAVDEQGRRRPRAPLVLAP